MLRKRVYGGKGTSRSVSRPKKKAKARGSNFRLSTLRNPHATAISPTMRCKIIYFEFISINPAAASVGTYNFSANGCYDPNVSGVGHQPTGFDEIMAIYGEYCVVGSTIRVGCENHSGVQKNVIFGISISRVTTTFSTATGYIENGDTVYTFIADDTSGETVKSLRYSADISKLSGLDVTQEESFAGTGSANPAEQRYYQVWAGPMDGSSDLSALSLTVEITYDVIFRDRVKPNTS